LHSAWPLFAYNRRVQRWVLFCLLIGLAACSSSVHNKDAIRQGVIDHLSARKGLDLDLSAMEVEVSSVSFRENEADATVSFKPKGGEGGGMQMKYTLERKADKWAVKTKAEAGGSPHGMSDPHGGAAPGGELPQGHPPVNPPEPGKGK